jgi:uncharacterized membrane protein
MSNIFSAIKGAGVGIVLMYFLDPDRGRRRRALVRDQLVRVWTDLRFATEVTEHDLRNRTRGILAEAMGLVSGEGAPDHVLVERVRANIGRVVRNSHAINVHADGGRIFLSGPILARDVPALLLQAASTRGVKHVENNLEVHETAANVPALQGAEQPMESTFELMQQNWSPTTRLLTTAGGAMVLLRGLGRGGISGLIMAALGGLVSLRGATNMEVSRLIGRGGRHRGIDVQKTINVNAPVEQVYDFWTRFENFPRFMAHVQEVQSLGNNRWHWAVKGPANVPVEWTAFVTDQIDNNLLAWKSEKDQMVESAGIVQFQTSETGGTRVTVRMSYNPPAGILGHAVAAIFGVDPKQAMDEDLMRFKSLIEHGKTTTEGEEVTREEVAGTARSHTY